MTKKILIISFLFLFFLPFVYAHVWDGLTIGIGDNRYCKQMGDCILHNLTIINGTIQFANVTVVDYNVTGNYFISGNVTTDVLWVDQINPYLSVPTQSLTFFEGAGGVALDPDMPTARWYGNTGGARGYMQFQITDPFTQGDIWGTLSAVSVTGSPLTGIRTQADLYLSLIHI